MTDAAPPDPWAGASPSAVTLVLLTAVAGGVDAIAFLHLGGSFVSNQTGNVLLLGISVTRDTTTDTAASATSLAGFALGAAAIGRWVAHQRGRHAPQPPTLVIGAESALLALAAVMVWAIDVPDAVLTAPLAVSMGMQAGLARALGLSYLTAGYITGSTTAAAMRSPLGDRSDRWWWHGAVPLATIAAGAAVTAAVAHQSVPGGIALLALVTAIAGVWARRVRTAAVAA